MKSYQNRPSGRYKTYKYRTAWRKDSFLGNMGTAARGSLVRTYIRFFLFLTLSISYEHLIS